MRGPAKTRRRATRGEPPGRTADHGSLARWSLASRLAYVGVILLATLSGLEPDFNWARMVQRLGEAFDLSVRARDVVDGVRNVALFAGWGAVWLATAPGTRLVTRIRDAVLTGALLSVGVELIQSISTTRTASVLDVATNTAGAFAGAVVVLAALWAVQQRRSARSFVGIPAFIFAGAYTAAAALEAFIPLFRQDTLPGTGGGPLSRLLYAVREFEWASLTALPIFDLLLFAPAGALWVAAVVEAGSGYRSAFRRVAVAGGVGAVAIEIARGVASQPIVAGSAVVHAAAIAGGAWAAARWLPSLSNRLRGRERPLALYAAWAMILALWAWRPFLPVTSLAAFGDQFALQRLTPLASHAMRMDLFSVVDLVRQFCLLVPAGALLAVWPLRRTGLLRGPLPAVYLAVGLEAGQLLVAGRIADITDALVGVAAVLLGWIVVRRTAFPVYGEAVPGARPRQG